MIIVSNLTFSSCIVVIIYTTSEAWDLTLTLRNLRQMLIFSTTQEHFLSDSMSLARCQINLIDANFHLQKVWKCLIKNQLTKSDPKLTRGGKCPPSLVFRQTVLTKYLCNQKKKKFSALLYCSGLYNTKNAQQQDQIAIFCAKNNRIFSLHFRLSFHLL